jgi:NifU-like protein involved in Fe-S cluster formation
MSGQLYSLDVLRMAAAVADFPTIEGAALKDERRSPTCGSRMTVTLALDVAGRVSAVGLDAKACALGQAAAAIMARSIIGRTGEQVLQASDDWQAYLAREKDDLPDWPDLALLAAGRDYPARHPSMRLAFEAAASLLTKEAAEDRRHG